MAASARPNGSIRLGSGGCRPSSRGSIRLGRADAAAAAGVAKQQPPGFIWISRRLHLDLVV